MNEHNTNSTTYNAQTVGGATFFTSPFYKSDNYTIRQSCLKRKNPDSGDQMGKVFMDTTLIFIHGLDSSSQGTKARFFRGKYEKILTPDFRGDLAERLDRLEDVLAGKKNIILVGSSFGGLMATIYGLNHPKTVKKLVLLAPALNFQEFAAWKGKRTDIPASLFIGRHDTVTLPEPVTEAARATFTNLTIDLLDDDHLLHKTYRQIDWQNLLI